MTASMKYYRLHDRNPLDNRYLILYNNIRTG